MIPLNPIDVLALENQLLQHRLFFAELFAKYGVKSSDYGFNIELKAFVPKEAQETKNG